MTGDINVCGTLREMHTMDAGQYVECRYVIPPCGQGVSGGGILTLNFDPESARLLMLGDHVSIHLRPAP